MYIPVAFFLQIVFSIYINVRETRRGKQRVDNPEKLATLDQQGTRQTIQKHNTTQYLLDTPIRNMKRKFFSSTSRKVLHF